MKLHISAFFDRMRRDPSGCWTFTGATNRFGYGFVRVQGRTRKAHRYAYHLYSQGAFDLDSKQDVLHTCDNGLCCAPTHLYLGDDFDNMRDMRVRKRHPMYRGEFDGSNNPRAKLTEEQVRAARTAHLEGVSVAALARMFKVGWTTMDMAIRGETWKHL